MEQYQPDNTMAFPDGTLAVHAVIYILIYELQRQKEEKKQQPTQSFSEYLNEQ